MMKGSQGHFVNPGCVSKALAAGSRLEGDVEVKRVWKAGVGAELCFSHSVIAGILR